MSLENVSTADLEAARIDLDHQIRALRDRKLEIARVIEGRLPGEEPQDRPAASQTVAPGFVEPESVVPSLGGESEPARETAAQRKRRWRK